MENRPFSNLSNTVLTLTKEVSERLPDQIDGISSSKKYKDADDKKIWNDFNDGNEAAFIHVYVKYFGELLNFGFQFTRDKNLIEDIIQNLFIHLRNKRPSLPKLKSSIRLYLFQCLKRRFLDHQKTNRYVLNGKNCSDTVFEVLLAKDTHMIDDQNHQERVEKLRKSIEKLNIKQREIIYYFYYKDFTYEEIKIMMGFSNVKSVRNLVYKTVGALRKLIVSLVILFFFC